MGITFYTTAGAALADRFAQARQLIQGIEDELPIAMRGKLQAASDLLTDVADAHADGPRALNGAL